MCLCLCVYICVSVCVCKFLEKLDIGISNELLAVFTLYEEQNNNGLKPFGYKVMTIYVTRGYCFQTWEDSWGQLDTSTHNCYCIMGIASKALHQINHNLGSLATTLSTGSKHSCQENYFLAPPISSCVLCTWFTHM